MELLNKISLIGLSGVAIFAAILTTSVPLLPDYQYGQKLVGSIVVIKPSVVKVSVETPNKYIFVGEKPKFWL